MREIECVSLKKNWGGGVFLSISMHLLQIVSIYLFIFFPEEKKCVRVCLSDLLVYPKS